MIIGGAVIDIQTFGFGGGTHAAGNSISPGGFDSLIGWALAVLVYRNEKIRKECRLEINYLLRLGLAQVNNHRIN